MSVATQCDSGCASSTKFENEYNHDHVEFMESGSPMEAAVTCSLCAY